MVTSTVDKILARFGMQWRLDPYRIVNSNGVIVQKGPDFNLDEKILTHQSALFNHGKMSGHTTTSSEK